MEVKLLKYPTEQDWLWVKTCTLNTVGKKLKSSTTQVNYDWKIKLLEAEHSPIRELWFGFKMEIPYWVAMHFRTHQLSEAPYPQFQLDIRPDFKNDYISTQRDDRNRNDIPRGKKPQDEIVSYIMSINAPALVNMAHRRLCKQASPETRQVMQMIVDEVVKVCPEMKNVLVPLCKYRNGKCTEMFSCKEVQNG
jgi:thymidylate synthase ThyX